MMRSTVAEDASATTVTVLANDTDGDGGPISIALVTQPANGAVVNNGTDVSYTPNADYCNTPPGTTLDTFTYTLTPGGSTATVSVTVTCGNDAPVVDLDGTADDPGGDVDFAVTFTEGTPVVIVDATNLTVSDIDNPNLVSATVTITNLQDAGIETLAATTAGTSITAVYTAATGVLSLTGTDTLANYQQVLRTVMYNNTSQNPNTTARLITFVVNDGTDTSATATTTLSITSVNNPPTVTPVTFTLDENSTNGTVVGTVTATDPDLPAQTLSYAITAGNPGNAFAINSSTGQITVATSTALDFETTPTFNLTVQVTDDGTPAQSGSATITVNLTNANDPPVVMAATFAIPENSANGTTVGTPVTFTDTDVGQTHTFAISAGNIGGAFAINASGQITVANNTALDFETTPAFNLTVQVTDNGTPAQSGSATITVNLTDVNEAPTATAQSITTDEDIAIAITLAGTDPENQTLTFVVATSPTKGGLSGTPPNLTYTPTANLNGPDRLHLYGQ